MASELAYLAGGLLAGVGKGVELSGVAQRDAILKRLDQAFQIEREGLREASAERRHKETLGQTAELKREDIAARKEMTGLLAGSREKVADTAAASRTEAASAASRSRAEAAAKRGDSAVTVAEILAASRLAEAKARGASAQEVAKIEAEAKTEAAEIVGKSRTEAASTTAGATVKAAETAAGARVEGAGAKARTERSAEEEDRLRRRAAAQANREASARAGLLTSDKTDFPETGGDRQTWIDQRADEIYAGLTGGQPTAVAAAPKPGSAQPAAAKLQPPSGSGTKTEPFRPTTAEEFKAIKAGQFYVNPKDGLVYQKS